MKKLKSPSAAELREVIKAQFGIDVDDYFVNFELILRSKDPERYDSQRARFDAHLAFHPKKEEVRRRSYFGETFAVHLQSWFAWGEVEGIPSELLVHYPICTIDEIGRIGTPTSAADHLLILRADAVADSARLGRVFMRRRERDPERWSLTSHFDLSAFERYLTALPDDMREKCLRVPAGMSFLREPNGACIRSPHGDFIVVSESLQSYLYYMNVFLLAQEDIPKTDCLSALMIALRTSFLTETPDFDLDPRGRLPREVNRRIAAIVEDQMQFVIGHEYAHVLLDHLSASLARLMPFGVIPTNGADRPVRYYTPRQEQEFAADAGSILHASLNQEELSDRLNGAIWFFLGLDVLNAVSEYVNPSVRASNSHPEPIERIWALRKQVASARTISDESIYSDQEVRQAVEWVNGQKEALLRDFIPYHVDTLETYGSVYLPSFRRTELIDRFDY